MPPPQEQEEPGHRQFQCWSCWRAAALSQYISAASMRLEVTCCSKSLHVRKHSSDLLKPSLKVWAVPPVYLIGTFPSQLFVFFDPVLWFGVHGVFLSSIYVLQLLREEMVKWSFFGRVFILE
ncbi:hypothetical protein HCH54_003157 [Aspergillus fumigatus]